LLHGVGPKFQSIVETSGRWGVQQRSPGWSPPWRTEPWVRMQKKEVPPCKGGSKACCSIGRDSCESPRPAGAEIPYRTLSQGFTLGYSRLLPPGGNLAETFMQLPCRGG